MTGQRFRRRGFLFTTAATVAGCLGDGGREDGDATGDGTDGSGSPSNASGGPDGTDCAVLTERYVRHDPGRSPWIFTVELPESEDEIYTVEKRYWELQLEKAVGSYEAEIRLRQSGPYPSFEDLPSQFRGEGDHPTVTTTTFGGTEVPIRRFAAQDRPQFFTAVPVPGSDDAYATVVTSFGLRGPGGQAPETCLDEGNAVQRHAITSIAPNPDHTFGSTGAGGNASSSG